MLIILLTVLLVLCLAALAWLITALTPGQTNNILLFYTLVALATFAITTLIGFFGRRLFGQREFINAYIGPAGRQGVWLSLILVTSLILLSHNLFTWINTSLLIFIFIFFESYLLTKDKHD